MTLYSFTTVNKIIILREEDKLSLFFICALAENAYLCN